MGTYTTNYQLYMPTVGERGWGTLINGNFTTIDTTMKGLNTRLTAVENEVNGALSCTSVATSGTITSNGMLNANGGVNGGAITGTTITATNKFSGTLYGKIYVNAKIATSGEVQYATCAAQSTSKSITYSAMSNSSFTKSSIISVNGYTLKSISYPVKISAGIYIASNAYISGSLPSSVSRTVTLTVIPDSRNTSSVSSIHARLYINSTQVNDVFTRVNTESISTTVKNGDKVYFDYAYGQYSGGTITLSISAASTYYLQTT